jgi:hypothetical protein
MIVLAMVSPSRTRSSPHDARRLVCLLIPGDGGCSCTDRDASSQKRGKRIMMYELNPMALAREFYSRATPYRLLKRVAGIAFNFSSISIDALNGTRTENPAEDTTSPNGMQPAFRAL